MNAPLTKEVGPVSAFGNFLEKLKPQLELALPAHMNANRMARLALTAFSTSTKLQQCEPRTIAASLMVAGQLGLEPGVNGQGWLIPYKKTCTFVPGWKGLVDLVNRAGRATVYTGVIFKDQAYVFTDGARRDLVVHDETELLAPEDITHAYAIGWVKGAEMPVIEFWPVAKIRRHRDKYNKVGNDHYSFRDWEMYSRKVPLLQVLKYMPQSIELSNAIAINNAAESGHGATIDGFGVVIEDGDGDGGDQGSTGNQDSGRQEKAAWTDEQFKKSLPNWLALIAKKTKTIDEVIAMANTKGPLTDDQIKAIKDAVTPRDAGENPAAVTFAQVEAKLLKSDSMDVLDLAADLIGEVSDPAQRSELSAIYNKRKEELQA